MLGIRTVEFQFGFQRDAVGQTSVQAFIYRVAWRVDEMNTLNSPSLRRFSGVVSSWKKSLKDFSCTSKKSGYSRRVLEDANEIR